MKIDYLLGCCKSRGFTDFFDYTDEDFEQNLKDIRSLTNKYSSSAFLACILNHSQHLKYGETLKECGFEIARKAKGQGYSINRPNKKLWRPPLYFYIRTNSID